MLDKPLLEQIIELAPQTIDGLNLTRHWILRKMYQEERAGIMAEITGKVELILKAGGEVEMDQTRLQTLVSENIRLWVREKLDQATYSEYKKVMQALGRSYVKEIEFWDIQGDFLIFQELLKKGLVIPPAKQRPKQPTVLGSEVYNFVDNKTGRVRGVMSDCTLIVFVDETPEEKLAKTKAGPTQGQWKMYKIDRNSVKNLGDEKDESNAD